MNEPRILHLISSGGFLGAESVVLELAKESVAAGHCATIGVLENSRNPHLELAEAATSLGLGVHIFPCRGRFDLGTIASIRDLVQKENPDIIHSHGYKSNFYALSATRNKVPWVVTNHLWKRTTLNLKLYAYLDSFLIKYSRKIVAVSDKIATEMLKTGIPREKILVIDNGIDLKRFSKGKDNNGIKNSFGFDSNSRIIGTVASLTEEKGHIYLLEAARTIVSSFPEARFLIVGEGRDRGRLEEKASELGLSGKVIFTGSRRDVPEILSILDIFVLPSLKEGLPMALLEAMAARVPVVATNVGAIPTVIEDGVTGTLISPKDSAVIPRAICQILSDKTKSLEMAQKGFERVRDNFSSQKMASKYFDVYKELMQGTGCSA